MAKRPNSMRHLDDAIRRASGGGARDVLRRTFGLDVERSGLTANVRS